jgi:hypothetical protein
MSAATTRCYAQSSPSTRCYALSAPYQIDDIVAVASDQGLSVMSDKENPATSGKRLCVVRSDGLVLPLCRRAHDVETDLWLDRSEFVNQLYWSRIVNCHVTNEYGVGYYGQRPVPSLGGGPGYGAEADEVWSVSDETLEAIEADGVYLPTVDMGISHGEKSRGGSF